MRVRQPCYQPNTHRSPSIFLGTEVMSIRGLYKCAALNGALLLAALLVACGGGSMASSPSTPTNSPGTSSPAPATAQAMVAMVMEENHSFEQVIGNQIGRASCRERV